jgi:hypothetical protein
MSGIFVRLSNESMASTLHVFLACAGVGNQGSPSDGRCPALDH